MQKKKQAVILAAGFGKRMRPLSYTTHKTLLKINGVSVLASIIQKLVKNDILDVTMVLGYQAKEIQEHLAEEFPDLNFNYVINEKYDSTNNLVSLAMGLQSIKDRSDVVIIESDLIFGDGVLKRLLDSRHDNVALVDKYRRGMDGTVVSIENDIITGVIPPHLQGSDFSFKDKYKTLNIYKFTEEFCFGAFLNLLNFYTHDIKDSYYELLLGVIIYLRAETIHSAILEGEVWTEIDDPNDLQLAKYMFEPNSKQILDNSYGGFWNYPVTDFCYLRNMYFPPASFLSDIKNNLDKTIYEYGSSQKILNRKLSYFVECNEEDIIAVNGVSQVFPFLRTYFKGKSVLTAHPTFGDYYRVFPEANRYSDTIGINLDELEDKNEDLIVFVNPNNPTGTTLSSEKLFDFAKRHPKQMILVDESFIDFSDETSIVDMLKKESVDNIIIMMSLSKVLGVAGLRIGYVFSQNKNFMAALADFIPIWNMNTIAENFIEILLKYRPEYEKSLKLVKRDRQDFFDELEQVSIVEKLYPSGGDYLLAQLTLSQEEEHELCQTFMNDHKIYLKPVREKFEDGKSWMRFAVHQPKQNFRLCKLMQDWANAKNL